MKPLQKGVYSQKEFAPIGAKFFPLAVDPFKIQAKMKMAE